MSDIQERIDAAKKQVQSLKSEIEVVRGQKDDASLPAAAAGHNLHVVGDRMLQCTKRWLKGHFGKVYAMGWAPDSIQLVSASQDGKMIIWNGYTTNKNQLIPLRSCWVMSCCFEPTVGQLVACGGLDNMCSIFHVVPGQQVMVPPAHELTQHDGYLSCCRFLDATQMLTSSGDSTCILWDIEKNEGIRTFVDHGGDAMSVTIKPNINRNIFVSGSCDATAKVWDTRDGKCQQTFVGHESDVNTVQFFPDGLAFATGSDDSTCRLWDLRSYSALNVYYNDKILCSCAAVDFSLSGRFLFAGYDDCQALVWDTLSDGKNWVYSLPGHDNHVCCLGVNPKGDAFCTGSWDNSLKIWT